MKAHVLKVSVEATITLNEGEIKMLRHILSYGPAKRVWEMSSGLHGAYPLAAYEELFNNLQTELGKITYAANEAGKQVF